MKFSSQIKNLLTWIIFIILINIIALSIYNIVHTILNIITLFICICCIIKYKYDKNLTKDLNTDLENIEDKKKIVIVITIYKESDELILNTIKSILTNKTNHDLLLFLVSDGQFDNSLDSEINSCSYLPQYSKISIIERDGNILTITSNSDISRNLQDQDYFFNYIHVQKSDQKGKKDSHRIFFEFDINYDYVLFLDADTAISSTSINTMSKILKNIKYSAVCGETKIYNKHESIVSVIQIFEYFVSHLVFKIVENEIFTPLVLSGCFTMFKKNDMSVEILNQYFKSENDTNINSLIFDNLYKYGEDRLLTILMIKNGLKMYYCENAKCYTYAPVKFSTLIKQRIRWTKSFIFCNIFLLMTFKKSIRFIGLYLLILYELYIVLILPVLIINSIVNIVLFYKNVDFLIIPLANIIFIFCKKLKILNLFYWLIYTIFSILFTVIIPILSIITVNDQTW